MKWKAVVFDLDDTLYPEKEYVWSGFRAVSFWANANLLIPVEKAYTELKSLFEQGVRGNTFDQWISAYPFDSLKVVPELVRVYREHFPEIKPFAGIPRLLAALRLRGKLGLLSDGLFGVQKMKLQALSLNSMFDAVIFSGEIGKEAGKPNPATFRIMLERLGLVGQQAVYVGDNPLKDFPGAKKNGMGTIRLRLPDGLYSEKEPPDEEYAPELEFSDLAGLEKHLLELVSVKRE